MRILRSTGEVEDDDWERVDGDEVTVGALPGGNLIVSLQMWRANAALAQTHRGRIGVWLHNSDEPESLAADVLALPLLAVDFPAFNDGRGLSSAVLLRTRMGYTGDLRAIGAVQLDQLSYMCRCGFTSFALTVEADAAAMRKHLVVMTEYYQSSATEPTPLFRRR